MKRFLITAGLLIVLVGTAHAFGLGLGNRFGRLGASSGGGTITPSNPSVLLINTGSALLINTGSKFLIHN